MTDFTHVRRIIYNIRAAYSEDSAIRKCKEESPRHGARIQPRLRQMWEKGKDLHKDRWRMFSVWQISCHLQSFIGEWQYHSSQISVSYYKLSRLGYFELNFQRIPQEIASLQEQIVTLHGKLVGLKQRLRGGSFLTFRHLNRIHTSKNQIGTSTARRP